MPDGETQARDFVLIAANPRAGARMRDRHLRELADWLRGRGLSVEILSDLPRIERLAADLFCQGRLRALVGAGGDGTLAELMNRTPPGTPLAIYPMGTANLVARYVGASSVCAQFGQMIVDGVTVQFDAGRANGRLFMAVCSCGFDAEVVRRLHTARTGNITSFAYLTPIVSALSSYPFPELHVSWSNGIEPTAEKTSARWVFVSNLPCYAGGLKPGAGALSGDGMLDLCALQKGGLWHALRYLPYVFVGAQSKLADCVTARATRLRIESDVADVPYEIDGDAGGTLPVEIDVVANRLTLVVPAEFAASRGDSSPA